MSNFFWKRLLQLCPIVATSWDPTHPLHTTWDFMDLMVVSLPEPTQPEAEYSTYVLAAHLQGNVLKRSCCPRLSAHPHCTPHTHLTSHSLVGYWMYQAYQSCKAQCGRASDPKYLIASVWTLNFKNCFYLGTQWSSKDFALLSTELGLLRASRYLDAHTTF